MGDEREPVDVEEHDDFADSPSLELFWMFEDGARMATFVAIVYPRDRRVSGGVVIGASDCKFYTSYMSA